MKTRTKLWLVTAVVLIGILGVLVAIKAGQIGSMIKAGKTFTPPPESVSSAKVERAEWAGSTPAIGTLVAVRGVVVGAELAGTVRQIGFDSGTFVKKGDLLVKLDTSTEEAQLASAKAESVLARLTLQRTHQLRQGGANTPAELEAAEARAAQTQAAVAALEATISKKTIRAPFDGRVAIRQVELGQVLSAGAAVASLQAVSPIHAEFWLPQQALATLRLHQRAQIRSDIFTGARWDGEITTINTEIDPATRNVRVRATVPNPDGRLRPGMFVSVDLLSQDTRPVVVIPATSVLFAPYGDSVFVLEEKKDASGKTGLVARQKLVRLGERRGDFVEVQNGLEGGELIASSGAFKLRNGMAVTVNDALAPQAELHPKPVD